MLLKSTLISTLQPFVTEAYLWSDKRNMCNRNRLVFFLVSALFVTAWAASAKGTHYQTMSLKEFFYKHNSFLYLECRDPLQEYRKCQSSSCVKTCANPNPTICTFDCQQGCYCKEPYVLDQSTNQCVEIAKCTSKILKTRSLVENVHYYQNYLL